MVSVGHCNNNWEQKQLLTVVACHVASETLPGWSQEPGPPFPTTQTAGGVSVVLSLTLVNYLQLWLTTIFKSASVNRILLLNWLNIIVKYAAMARNG